ncbi:hypothetical protein V8G54_035256 [Vigna mungo]|uniref:Uncharacterized protein n=1 Tax=Vigna mungo TaxID=3915 RepID=A0AAQ3REE7_VIGMU
MIRDGNRSGRVRIVPTRNPTRRIKMYPPPDLLPAGYPFRKNLPDLTESVEKPENGKGKGWIRIPVKRRRAAAHPNPLFFCAMAESESQGHSWISYGVSLLIVLLIALHVFALVYWIYRLATDNRSQQPQQQQQEHQQGHGSWCLRKLYHFCREVGNKAVIQQRE